MLPGIHDLRIEGTRVRCEVDAEGLNGVLRHLTSLGLLSLVSQPPTLEELFMRHYQIEQPAGATPSGRHAEVSR